MSTAFPAPLRVLVADDEPLARETVGLLLRDRPEAEVRWEAATGAATVRAIRQHRPDLVFLDVQMPEGDGFAVVDEIGAAQMPVTVFVTAFDHYALRAFEARALDYLLKPYDDARFFAAFERACTRVSERQAAQEPSVSPEVTPDRIMVKSGGQIVFVEVASIDWVEAAGDYMVLHVDGRRHLIRETMAALERQLAPHGFVRIHRSSLVNLDRVVALRPSDHGDYRVRLRDDTTLRLSRRYWDRLEARLGRLR
ncbi:MAG: LytTR family DNA-binding domain-containing protein [Bacteroidota bacterium]